MPGLTLFRLMRVAAWAILVYVTAKAISAMGANAAEVPRDWAERAVRMMDRHWQLSRKG